MGKKNRRNNKTVKGNVLGLYGIEGIEGESEAKINPLGKIRIQPGATIKDAFLQSFEIDEYITGHAFVCNITDKYITTTKKLPVLYITLEYYKSLLRSELFKVFLYFTIEQEVKSEEQFLGNNLKGKYSLELYMDDCSKELDKSFEVFPGKKEIVKDIINVIKSDSLKSIFDDLIKEIEERRQSQYGDCFEMFEPPKATISLKDLV